jgi:transcriptional regulator with XRE-family HTH domain
MSLDTKIPDPIDVEVGRRIRAKRLMLRLTQTELGDQLGVSFQQIQKYERGKNRVGAGRLQSIAKILCEPVSFFFQGPEAECKSIIGAAELPLDVMTFVASQEGWALNNAFARIENRQVRRLVLSLVAAIAFTEKDTDR